MPILIGIPETITKWFSKRDGGVGNRRTTRDLLNYSIVEASQNTEKSPGDLRRPAVTQTTVKDHKLTLV